ncbi:hypothetical protein D9758_004295 [Tetrapyrgos nigripes]|uniref:Uncharacterized protein n=1 Tax=Tetrapyrgos nigripes TaxID=182062 RepID=A0A8H5GU18_9AGAR|nr:hypothetical protein D9758_004295 [Tetrapyrgos nigripes]
MCRLTSLKKVVTNYPIPLDDASVQMMAKSWPDLTSLTIQGNEMGVAIQALGQLAQYCPLLDELCIPLAVDMDIPLYIPGQPLHSHRLSLICPRGEREPKNPAIVARHLDRLFPFVEVN